MILVSLLPTELMLAYPFPSRHQKPTSQLTSLLKEGVTPFLRWLSHAAVLVMTNSLSWHFIHVIPVADHQDQKRRSSSYQYNHHT